MSVTVRRSRHRCSGRLLLILLWSAVTALGLDPASGGASVVARAPARLVATSDPTSAPTSSSTTSSSSTSTSTSSTTSTTTPPTTRSTRAPTTTVPATSTTVHPTTTTTHPTTKSSSNNDVWVWVGVAVAAALLLALILFLLLARRRRLRANKAWVPTATAAADSAVAARDLLVGESAQSDPAVHESIRANVGEAAGMLDRVSANAPDDEARTSSHDAAEQLRGLLFAIEAQRLLPTGRVPPTADQLAQADQQRRQRESDLAGALIRLRRRIREGR
jgi:hypothetical protein